MENYIGEIRLFAGSYAPAGWMLCDGASLPAAQFQALYALIGTRFGGAGQHFLLPDLNGSRQATARLRHYPRCVPARGRMRNPLLAAAFAASEDRDDPPLDDEDAAAAALHYIIAVDGIFPAVCDYSF